MGDGTRILFWHDRWVGDDPLKILYHELYKCSNDKNAYISDVLCHLEEGNDKVWNLRFYRELDAIFSLLDFIQVCIPRGVGSDNLCWCLKGNGKIDTRSFNHEIRDAPSSFFPWKGVWKAKVPKKVVFFLWTTAHGQILTLHNIMIRGHPLANQCCICLCNGKFVDHLLHCPTIHSLWVFMIQLFGSQSVMLGSVAGLLFYWSHNL